MALLLGILALCGLSGALIYSFPCYLQALSHQPPERFAGYTFIFSLFVGSVCAALLTQTIGYHWPWTVKPEPWPLAVVIGLASNPAVPALISRINGFIETFGGK
jgi:drug/metabolite transporter (DMT)-like permease